MYTWVNPTTEYASSKLIVTKEAHSIILKTVENRLGKSTYEIFGVYPLKGFLVPPPPDHLDKSTKS